MAVLSLLLLCSLASAGCAQDQGTNNEQKIREDIEKFKVNDHNYCVGVFKELREFGNEVVPIGLEVYKTSASDRQKERIVLLLGGLQDERAVAFLIERLEKSDYAARSALWDTGAFAAPALRKVLKSPDKWPRDQAAVMLVKWGSREGLPVLLEGLKNETEDFKYSGVPDGFSIMGEESIPHLTGALQDKDARVRENAKYTLNLMGRGEVAVSPAAEPDKTGPVKADWRPQKLRAVLWNVTNLTADRKKYDPKVWSFAVSPDGNRIAYAVSYGGSGLWVMDSGGGKRSLVTRKINPGGDFAWSSGGRLAYEEYETNYTGWLGVAEFGARGEPAVQRIRKRLRAWMEEEGKKGPVTESRERDGVRQRAQGRVPSPDRRRFAYVAQNNLWLAADRRAAGELVTNYSGRGERHFGELIWSPDSALIAYTLSVTAGNQLIAILGGLDKYLCVLDVNKKIEERSPAPPGAVFRGLEWGPKGKKLYYAVDDIYLLDFTD